jgi:hypothetical protein
MGGEDSGVGGGGPQDQAAGTSLGYQVNDPKITLCIATPCDVHHAAGGNANRPTWRDLARNPRVEPPHAFHA